MKISVNDQELFTLTELQKQVICNDIHADILDEDLCRRLKWILMHKYEQCLKRLKNEWAPKLKDRFESLPTNDEALVSLIFSQQDYKNRKAREIVSE